MRRLFLFVIAFSGCAPAIQPGAPMLGHVSLPENLVKSNSAVNAINGFTLPGRWWQEFHDAGLDKFLDIALAGSPSLEEAHARLNKAQATVSQVKAALYPSIHSVGQVTRQSNSKNGNHDIYNGKTATIADINPLAVSYDLDFWNRNDEIIAASRASEQMAAAEYRQSALMISSSVVKTYFALIVAKQLAALQEEIIQQSEEQAHLLVIAYQAGIQPKIPSLSQNSDLLEEKAKLSTLLERVDVTQFALLELLGKAPADAAPPVAANVYIPGQFKIPERIDLNLISQRPDVQAALWDVKRQAHLEKVARDAFYPNVNLYALAGLNSIGLSNLLNMGSATYAFGSAIDLPLFEGGALEGRLHEAENSFDIAVHTYNRTVLDSVRQIAVSLATMKNARVQVDDKTASLALMASRREIAEVGFRSGVNGKIPYLEAAIRMNREKMAHLEDILLWINSITDMATSLGGGFGRWPG